MVDFTLSEEQQMLQELAREFATENVRPMAEHWDAESEFPMEAIAAAHELGLMNLHIPEAYGGMGMGTMDEVIVQEEFAWGDPGFATASYSNGLTAAPIITGGTEEQKEKYLGRLTEAPRIAAYAVTEPGAGSDVASIQSTAVKDGDHYILNGSKMWITGAGKADWFFVLAYTDKSVGYKGMSAFIVESSWDGVSLGKKETNMGQRASDTRSVNFEDVRVPVENLVGGVEGKGWSQVVGELALERSGPERFLSHFALLESFINEFKNILIKSGSKLIGKLIAELQTLRRMSFSIASMLQNGESPETQAAFVKELGNKFEKTMVETLREFSNIIPLYEWPSQLQNLFEDATLRIPSNSLRGGTTEIMKGIIAKQLGLR